MPCERRSGGLLLLWDKNINLEILSFSAGHIDYVIKDPISHWRFTSFYGNPNTSLRYHSWNLLKRLNCSSTLPWLVGGDFNEILSHSEKSGGAPRPANQMAAFL